MILFHGPHLLLCDPYYTIPSLFQEVIIYHGKVEMPSGNTSRISTPHFVLYNIEVSPYSTAINSSLSPVELYSMC